MCCISAITTIQVNHVLFSFFYATVQFLFHVIFSLLCNLPLLELNKSMGKSKIEVSSCLSIHHFTIRFIFKSFDFLTLRQLITEWTNDSRVFLMQFKIYPERNVNFYELKTSCKVSSNLHTKLLLTIPNRY